MKSRHLSLCAGITVLLAAPTAIFADDDDDEIAGCDAPEVSGDVVIAWDKVGTMHPGLGFQQGPGRQLRT